jgi:hypothetical protein
MKTYLLAVITSLVMAAVTAYAGETGVINQSGPYEATMRFYLHPAHGFPGTAESPQTPNAVAASGNAVTPPVQARSTVAVQKRSTPVRVSSR